MFASSTGRACGRCAAKTTVASVTPSRAIHAVTSAVTVMKATVPLPEAPSARVTSKRPTKRPVLPTICAQKSSADPRAEGSRFGGRRSSGSWRRGVLTHDITICSFARTSTGAASGPAATVDVVDSISEARDA